MGQFWLLVLAANYLLALIAVATVLRRRSEPTAMVAWIFAILTVPGLGMLLYWLLGSRRLHRKIGRRRRRVAHLLAGLKHWAEQQSRSATEAPEVGLPADLAGIAKLGRRLADMPAIGGNEVALLEEANATHAALDEALRAARHHIHMEYYIWQPDETGHHFRDLVIERARAGVECRLLLDAVGCRRVGRGFLRPLLDAGVRVAFFMPIYSFPLRKRWSVHLRNHRKIVVVDGQVALMGSQNIGDEYRGRLARLSPWYDTHMRLSGPAALFLQQTFAEDWYLAMREPLDSEHYFRPPQRPGSSLVQILSSGPDQSVSTLAQIVFAAVSSSRSSIRISTPYFVPDLPVRLALLHACYRGVQVKLVLPTRSDSQLALWAARSFYPELIDAGVEIHEYDGGVLHSKLVTVDDRWCLLGSANMDARSFRLNFEVTAVIYDPRVARDLSASIDRFCGGARRIMARDAWQRRTWRQVGEGAARLFAPWL
jgi:cardiolipin synthase